MIDLNANCLAQWHLNEDAPNGIILDATANNIDGLSTADTEDISITGKINKAFYLQAVWATYIDFGNVLNFEWNDPFSISCWLNHSSDLNGVGWGASIITKSKRESGGADIFPGWGLYGMNISADLFATFILSNNDTWMIQVEARDTPIDDSFNWHHVVVTYNGNGLANGVHIYIDNVDQALTVTQNNLGERTTVNAYSLNIGAINNLDAVWDGSFDETSIFNKVLSDEEVAFLYSGGSGHELLAESKLGVLFGLISDIHHSNVGSYWSEQWGGEWRFTNTALDRLGLAMDDWVANGIKLAIDGGDMINGFPVPIDGKTHVDMVAEVVAKFNAHPFITGGGKFIHMIGNHELAHIGGDGQPTWTDYWAAIDVGNAHATRANELFSVLDGGEVLAYSYEFGSFVFLMLHLGISHSTDQTNYTNWLGDRWAESIKPIIIINHYANKIESLGVRDKSDLDSRLQLYICGHDHRGTDAILTQDAISSGLLTFGTDDVWFFRAMGARQNDPQNTEQEGAPAANATQGSHYIVGLEPWAVQGLSRPQARIEITGFLKASVHSKTQRYAVI